MTAQPGWYPDPGGGQGLYRYWDGRAWSAAVTSNAASPAPTTSLGPRPPAVQPWAGAAYGQTANGQTASGQLGQTPSGTGYDPGGTPTPGGTSHPGSSSGSSASAGSSFGRGDTPGQGGYGQAYADYQAASRRKSPIGWWLGAAALLVVIVVVAVLVVRGISDDVPNGGTAAGQGSQNACPPRQADSQSPLPRPADGRVHGGPLSYPELGSPWQSPTTEPRVPFGTDVASQIVTVEPNYGPDGDSWVASVLVGELQAGDGFYTPQQGSQIVVKCILGAFYGDAVVTSDVKINRADTIDGHDGWLVESHLSFDIPGLRTKGELMIVAIVTTGVTAGIYYASIPDTTPQLVQPARDALKDLKVDG